MSNKPACTVLPLDCISVAKKAKKKQLDSMNLKGMPNLLTARQTQSFGSRMTVSTDPISQ